VPAPLVLVPAPLVPITVALVPITAAPSKINNINTCQVRGCRNRTNHVTSRHTCGNAGCLMNGHGKTECMDENKKKELEKYKNDIIGTPCIVSGCLDHKTHTTAGHSCLFCDMRPSSPSNIRIIKHLKYCPLNESTPSDEKHKIFNETTIKKLDKEFTNEVLNISVEIPKGTYTHVYSGMGSTWFVRRDLKGKTQYLIMLTDDWGQYGKEISRMPALKSFIHGFEKMTLV
jgi:hypothetical protein